MAESSGTHDRSLVATAAGVVFLVLGGGYLMDAAGWVDLGAEYVFPVVLILLGIVVLVGSFRRTGPA